MEETKIEIAKPSTLKEKDEYTVVAKQLDNLECLPPKIALAYSDFKFIEDSEYYRTFEAVSKTHNETHTVRALNVASSFYKADPSLASTLFVQEFLRLCVAYPQAAFIESFEINGTKIAYAIQHCQPLNHLLEKKFNPKDINIEDLLADVLSDVSFLLTTLKLSSSISIELQNINYIKSTSSFILSDWGKSVKDAKANDGTMSSDGTSEVYTLGTKVLEFHGIPKEEFKELELLKKDYVYNGALDAVLTHIDLPAESRENLKRMLTRDVSSRMKLGELKKERASKKTEVPAISSSKPVSIFGNSFNADTKSSTEGLFANLPASRKEAL